MLSYILYTPSELNIIAELIESFYIKFRGYYIGRRHRHGRSPSLLHLLAPGHYPAKANLIRDVALGALIAREIIKK